MLYRVSSVLFTALVAQTAVAGEKSTSTLRSLRGSGKQKKEKSTSGMSASGPGMREGSEYMSLAENVGEGRDCGGEKIPTPWEDDSDVMHVPPEIMEGDENMMFFEDKEWNDGMLEKDGMFTDMEMGMNPEMEKGFGPGMGGYEGGYDSGFEMGYEMARYDRGFDDGYAEGYAAGFGKEGEGKGMNMFGMLGGMPAGASNMLEPPMQYDEGNGDVNVDLDFGWEKDYNDFGPAVFYDDDEKKGSESDYYHGEGENHEEFPSSEIYQKEGGFENFYGESQNFAPDFEYKKKKGGKKGSGKGSTGGSIQDMMREGATAALSKAGAMMFEDGKFEELMEGKMGSFQKLMPRCPYPEDAADEPVDGPEDEKENMSEEEKAERRVLKLMRFFTTEEATTAAPGPIVPGPGTSTQAPIVPPTPVSSTTTAAPVTTSKAPASTTVAPTTTASSNARRLRGSKGGKTQQARGQSEEMQRSEMNFEGAAAMEGCKPKHGPKEIDPEDLLPLPYGYNALNTFVEKLAALKSALQKAEDAEKAEHDAERKAEREKLETRFASEIAALSSWTKLSNETRWSELHRLVRAENRTILTDQCNSNNLLPEDFASLSEKERAKALKKCKKPLRKIEAEKEFAGELPSDYAQMSDAEQHKALKTIRLNKRLAEMVAYVEKHLPDVYEQNPDFPDFDKDQADNCEKWTFYKHHMKDAKKADLYGEFKDKLPADYENMDEREQWQTLKKIAMEHRFTAAGGQTDPALQLPATYFDLDVEAQWEMLRQLDRLAEMRRLEKHFDGKDVLALNGYADPLLSDKSRWIELLKIVRTTLAQTLRADPDDYFVLAAQKKLDTAAEWAKLTVEQQNFMLIEEAAGWMFEKVFPNIPENWEKMTEAERASWKAANNWPKWGDDFEVLGKAEDMQARRKGEDKKQKKGGDKKKGGKKDKKSMFKRWRKARNNFQIEFEGLPVGPVTDEAVIEGVKTGIATTAQGEWQADSVSAEDISLTKIEVIRGRRMLSRHRRVLQTGKSMLAVEYEITMYDNGTGEYSTLSNLSGAGLSLGINSGVRSSYQSRGLSGQVPGAPQNASTTQGQLNVEAGENAVVAQGQGQQGAVGQQGQQAGPEASSAAGLQASVITAFLVAAAAMLF